MVLTETTVKKLLLVQGGAHHHFRGSSYDLTIGAIVTAKGKKVPEYALKSQGIVKVVSAEIIDLPANVVGYVHVKTSLCNIGVLALNIGIVDPCFTGPLQSTVLNFGKNRFRLREGDVFGRITFHEVGKEEDVLSRAECMKSKVVVRTADQVVEGAKDEMSRYLAADFLNLKKTARKAAESAVGNYRATMFVYIPVFVGALAFLTFLLNSSNLTKMEGVVSIKDRVSEQRELESVSQRLVWLADKNKELAEEINRLKQPVSSVAPIVPNNEKHGKAAKPKGS